LRKTCLKCPNGVTCTKLCEQMDNQIEPVFNVENPFRTEIPLSQTKTAEKRKLDGVEADIDDFGSYATDLDPEILLIREEETIRPATEHNESDSDSDMLEKINKYIKSVVPNIKLRRRYRAYLNCDTMSAIGQRAGVTKQSIQKQFAGITKKISDMVKERYNGYKISNIPFDLKRAVRTCRI
jgi:hypothetical protein